jgi:hypothetical protein
MLISLTIVGIQRFFFPHKSNKIFVTLQSISKEAMKVKGCNKSKIPHMQKEKLKKEE